MCTKIRKILEWAKGPPPFEVVLLSKRFPLQMGITEGLIFGGHKSGLLVCGDTNQVGGIARKICNEWLVAN